MTPKDRLEYELSNGENILGEFERYVPVRVAAERILQAEREVLARCQDKIESLMEKENESTDDQMWELRDWCKQQQEGL